MKISETFILLVVVTLGIEACHHGKGGGGSSRTIYGRRRRNVDMISSVIPTIRRSSSMYDINLELSDFFTKCLLRKTGKVFQSWRSVIDFVLRDTKWFSATDQQYCPEDSDINSKSTFCWQNRLGRLLKLGSNILPKAKQCVSEYVRWKKTSSPFLIRRKRRVVTTSNYRSPNQCLRINTVEYNRCLKTDLITPSNLRRYPSLKYWDGESVAKFILSHASECRITSRYTAGKMKYSEICPKVSKTVCPSTKYNNLVRRASPLYKVPLSCTRSLSKPKYTWGRWKISSCSRTCGFGVTRSTRQCRNSSGRVVSSRYCKGAASRTGRCIRGSCFDWDISQIRLIGQTDALVWTP